ncbi:hypothetical protein GCM10022243_21250 [Saccharothrix violaceirubra]|uniref:Cysteine-rich CPCC domain-containing protein n=1 Tax=Saccharothrix violaceirubra TaxID=413306 RepID=A0A7W7T8J2_9PSEU|nr:CPCC family cysteine-rich protein [Saccharothrix violaceirubra]MBB4968534.1 hypothetical protein [Saccharothrix violaceirubra]
MRYEDLPYPGVHVPRTESENSPPDKSRYYASYLDMRDVKAPKGGGPYTCPCCGHPTLDARAEYDICNECGWEDDGQDDHDSAMVRGGPNGSLSLDDARADYIASGGVRGNHVPPA